MSRVSTNVAVPSQAAVERAIRRLMGPKKRHKRIGFRAP